MMFNQIQDAMASVALSTAKAMLPANIGKFHCSSSSVDGSLSQVLVFFRNPDRPKLQITAVFAVQKNLLLRLIDTEKDECILAVVVKNNEEMEEKINSFVLAAGL